MNSVSIGRATIVYETASKCEITRHWVDHTGLADVSRDLRTLVKSLGVDAEDEFWQRTLGPVRRLAFAFCSTPLPFDHAASASCIEWDKLHRQVRLCQQLFPDSHVALASLVEQLQSLCEETCSPFTENLESLHNASGGISVILRNPRMNQAVAAYFATSTRLRNARVVSARQLRETQFCNSLVAIGPCGWFPEYVFSAPRASHIHVVSFRWIRDPWKPGPVFLKADVSEGDKNGKHFVGTMPHIKGHVAPPSQSMTDIQPLDLLPPLPPFGKAGSRIPGWPPNTSVGDETLPARLCHLSGERAVFVSAEEGASSLVIDSSETGDSTVRRVPIDELEPELSLLLRTSGGGDFIAPLADRILGDRAAELRTQQAGWKVRLVAAAQEQFGALNRRELAARVAVNLRSHGLSEARTANVHYWMSSKCIHPRKESDFAAILVFVGMADRTRELWEAMLEIDRAHKRAGQAIRQMLLQKIATSSLEPLERDGEMAFDLGEQDGGTLSAFQITAISEEEFEVPSDRIGVLLDSEE
ncbi:MAG: hypothetical protein SFX18_19945 [Pirellulales bacterium]|nr:hypothetical protein [Pirellulales bacterium]